jgi:hypothetical protein
MRQENGVPTVRFEVDLPLTDVIQERRDWMKADRCLPAAVARSLIREHAHAWPLGFVASLIAEALEGVTLVGDGDDASELNDRCVDAAVAAVRSIRPKEMEYHDC